MHHSMTKRTQALLCLAMAASAVACGPDAGGSGLVARAGDYELTVDDAVALLVDEESLPGQASVVRSLAELWADYILLAEAAADDSTFATVDFGGLVQPLLDQMMVLELRDSVIRLDTAITAEELERLYAEDASTVQLRARHILLTYPLQATEAQRDSVRAELESIRTRIVGGTSFEQMARTYSQDPGTASAGGDLGYFGRGDMVAPFEEAAMRLEPGQVSEVVQSPLGLHLIQLVDRRVPSFADVADDFRQFVLLQRNASAESTFVAGLEERASPTVVAGSAGVVRELARAPETVLTGRAADRALVQWSGGAFTAGELLTLLRADQPALRDEVIRGTDEDLDGFLLAQARRELLVEEARRAGLDPTPARVDSLETEARRQLQAAARGIGLMSLDQAPGEPRERAIARSAREALADNLSGATRIVPLGLVGFQLREGTSIVIFDSGIGEVLIEVATARANRSPSAVEESFGAAPGDSVAR
jgi:hypothetical protein